MPPLVLTIAGSDPSGGAGIQADLRTFSALGVTGVSVVTALTVQNSHGVQSVYPVPAEIVAAQIMALLDDARPQAVKIGMLGGEDQVRAVADVLRRARIDNIVLDPVLASTNGVRLLDTDGHTALMRDLLPLCRLVTPNQDEGQILGDFGTVPVLLKGGHLPGAPVDILRSKGQKTRFAGERVETPHTHGTGCLLASAIAAGLAWGLDLPEAVRGAKALLTRALSFPRLTGTGRGSPDPLAAASWQGLVPGEHARRQTLVRGLYVLTDPGLRPDRSAEDVTRAALAGGAQIVQLRDKGSDTPALIARARRLTELAHASGALLIVNDRVNVALAADADGVHLGPDDMHPRDARRLLGPDKVVGISVSTPQEAQGQAEYASYLGVGAIYGTTTKHDAGEPIGLNRIREVGAAYPDLPLVAIGGINKDNIQEIGRAGAQAAAVVSAVVCAPDMTAATRDLIARFTDGQRHTHS